MKNINLKVEGKVLKIEVDLSKEFGASKSGKSERGDRMENSYNKALYEIVRETSVYNKYIKWFVRTYGEDGTLISSCGYSTRKQAETHVNEMISIGKSGFPIGDHLSFTDYECIIKEGEE